MGLLTPNMCYDAFPLFIVYLRTMHCLWKLKQQRLKHICGNTPRWQYWRQIYFPEDQDKATTGLKPLEARTRTTQMITVL